MARTLTEINDELKSNFVSNPSIQNRYGLTPGNTFDQEFSLVSFERILFSVISFSIWTLEKLFDIHKEWIENRAREIATGGLAWYRKKSLEFQFGHALTFNDPEYSYATIDLPSQIVKLASASELTTSSGNLVLLKVANVDSAGNTIPLTPTDLEAFKAYIKKVKFAGVNVAAISREPDLLKVYYHIYIDALVMTAQGSLHSNNALKPVETAIKDYCKNLPFNGIFSVTELTDKIQQSTGVLNPIFDSASTKFGAQPYAPVVDYYQPNAGYLAIDGAFPLSITITYILA